jgi:tetratricopeptide (TPR) repeat protein
MYQKNKMVLEEYCRIVAKSDDYAWTVYTTWLISYNQLTNRVAEFLRLLGFMHYDGISEAIFQNACERLGTYEPELMSTAEDFATKQDITEFLKASFCSADSDFDKAAFLGFIGELRSYSLVDFDPFNRTYSVHSLLHDWVRRIPAESTSTTRSCTALLLALSVRYDSESQPCLTHQTSLLPHIDAVLLDFESMACTANDFAWVYQENNQWGASEPLLSVALEASYRTLGEAHSTTLYNTENLAITLSYQGRSSEAEVLRLKAVEACKQALGTDHDHTLWATGNLAIHHSKQKQFQSAKALQTQIFDIKKRTVGETHPDTLQAMGNLAITYLDLNESTQAERLQISVIDGFQLLVGPRHSSTLTSMQHLALTYAKQKKWSEFDQLQWNVTQIRLAALGEEHRDTRESMTTLAWYYRNLERLNGLGTEGTLFGDDSINTLTGMRNVVLAYVQQGLFEDAERLGKRVLDTSERSLGRDHKDTLESMQSLAYIYQKLGWDYKATALNKYWQSGYLMTSTASYF